VDADAGSPYTSYSRAKKFNSTYSKWSINCVQRIISIN
jgi:hypothetical protein